MASTDPATSIITELMSPTTSTTTPTTNTTSPTTSTTASTTNMTSPITNMTSPITNMTSPTTSTTTPTTNTTSPTTNTTSPTTSTTAPTTNTTSPNTNTTSPNTNTTSPTTSTTAPTTNTTSPNTNTTSPNTSTTATPTNTATTKPDEGGNSTATPTTTTTKPDEGGNSTATPTTTTTKPEEGGNSTATPTNTTKPEEGGNSTATPTTTTPSTSKKPGPCDGNPCGEGSTCEPFNGNFTCLCLAGDTYNYQSQICQRAKVFPGQIGLPNVEYNQNMSNKDSFIFINTTRRITDALDIVYDTTEGYSHSEVLQLLESNGGARSTNPSRVTAVVDIIFSANSDITSTDVDDKIKAAANNPDSILGGANFTEQSLCDRTPCDELTTNCESSDGSFTCGCDPGYIRTNFSERMCIACPSGQKASESECVDCPFGYSGFNCNSPWELVLVIVGSVLGGLLLITLILLPIVARKSPKKSSEKNRNADIGHYVNPSPAKAPLVNGHYSLPSSRAPSVNGSAFGNAGVPRIPRATATSSWDRATNLEMTRSNPVGRNPRLYEDPDNVNPYINSQQERPSSNSYAQSRSQINPYAQSQSQGQSNPYYVHDDGRRY
ncbi:mucin-13-like [Echeneis naucrates]|uniref:mucin-13-like n=1 Tax=Echeneis naucrates TaxID=173247 RepID=UPI0011133366|nr:mucin-13-like [Echeneis naucrates]